MIRRWAFAAAAVAMLLFPGRSWALPIVPTDYSLILASVESCATCSLVATMSDFFDTPSTPSMTIGSISSAVYFDTATQLYTYRHTVDPTLDDIARFTTAAGAVTGFDGSGLGTKAGWDFTTAGAAGGTGTALDFNLDYNPVTVRLEWEDPFEEGGTSGWDSSDAPITFFFQSVLAPGISSYNLTDGAVGTAETLASVTPEPGSMLLLGTGLLGAAAAIRRRGKKTDHLNA